MAETPQRMLEKAKVAAGAVDDGIVADMAVGDVVLVDYLAGGDVDGMKWRMYEVFYLWVEWWASLSRYEDRRREIE